MHACIRARGGLRAQNDVSPRPLLPQIATMRMTVLNFSFAGKLQSKLSSPTTSGVDDDGPISSPSPKPASPLSLSLSLSLPCSRTFLTFLPPGTLRPERFVVSAGSLPQLRPRASPLASSRGRKRGIVDRSSIGATSGMVSRTTAWRRIVKNDRRRS